MFFFHFFLYIYYLIESRAAVDLESYATEGEDEFTNSKKSVTDEKNYDDEFEKWLSKHPIPDSYGSNRGKEEKEQEKGGFHVL